jgi:hypothetical protein
MDEGVPLLVVLLVINNVGQVKSIADNFQLHLNDSTLAALLIGNERFILHGMIGESSANIDLVLIWNEFIHRRAVNGIGVGEQKRGWLVAEGIKTCSKSHGAQITFKDTVGKRYSLKIDNLEKVPPIPSLYVLSRFLDITYPFRERQWVEKFKRNAGVDSTVVFLSNAK